MQSKSKYSGVTLFELIVVMVLVGILGSAMSLGLTQGLRAYLNGQRYTQGDWQARTALERMTREIRTIASGAQITTMGSSDFNFTDIYGSPIDFSQAGTQILRNNQAIADNVQTLSFTYFTNNGTIATVNTSVCYISINVEVNYQNVVSNLSTVVYPWNLK